VKFSSESYSPASAGSLCQGYARDYGTPRLRTFRHSSRRTRPPAGTSYRHGTAWSAFAGDPGAQGRCRACRCRAHGSRRGRRRRRRSRRGCRRQLAHRPRIRDRRDDRRQCASEGGRRGRRSSRAVHPYLFHDLALRVVHRGGGGAEQAHPRRLREEERAVQLGGRSRGECDQDRTQAHRSPGRRSLRSRLSRPHQPHHGADGQVDAVQERVRAVRPRGLPCADVVPVQRWAHRSRCRRPSHLADREADRRGQPRGRHRRADPGRRRIHRSRRRLPPRARRLVPRERRRLHRRRSPGSRAPVTCSPARSSASNPT